jgi:hypothetical protein
MVGAGFKPAPTMGWKPAHPGHLGSTNRSARASAAHLRAGSPHAQGTSVAPWWGRVSNPPPLWAGSPRTQGTSVVQTDPHTASAAHLRAGSLHAQGISSTMVGAGFKPAPTTGWKPAQPGHLGSTNRSAHSQCSSPAGWKPTRPGHQ